MNVSADGSYNASTISVTTVGKFYLQAGKLRYRSSRTTPLAMPSAEVLGTASVSEDNGKTVLTLMPEDPNYLGRAEYERVKWVRGACQSPMLTSATGTGWERTPWHATQRAAWEALRQVSAVG
jgi:hypothetical protein